MRTFGTAADLVLNVNWSYWGQNKRGLNVTLVTFCHTCNFLSHLSCPITFCYVLSHFVTFCYVLSHLLLFVTLLHLSHCSICPVPYISTCSILSACSILST